MEWQETGTVAARALSAARVQLHYGAQVLGAAAHALLEHREDDGHTNLGYSAARRSLYSRDLGSATGIGLHLDLPTGALVFRRGDQSLASLALEGSSLTEALTWASERTGELLGVQASLVRREYADFPGSPLDGGAAFARAAEPEGSELARWFGNARELLETLRNDSPELSSVRVWPHHFDLGALLPVAGGEDRTIGLGLSPGDSYYDQPYFYCAPYPQPAAGALPDLPVGHWHTQGFISAIATAEELQARPSQSAAAQGYLSAALMACRAILG